MKERNSALACVAINEEGKILLMRRASTKRLSPNKWFVIGAFPLSEKDDFEKWAHSELMEETGADGEILKTGRVVEMSVDGKLVKIHSFLAKRHSAAVELNEEHTDFAWVDPTEVKNFDTVEGTYELVSALLRDE